MSHRTRREFLVDSMIAAAAAAAATGTARSVLAADVPATSTSPNEKLGVAIVGLKGRGGSHINSLAGKAGVEILYAVDADRAFEKRCDEIAKRQGDRAPKFETDLRKVLEDKRVDIVSIATPNHLHALQAIWSIQAGKDVYVEKPVSHNVSEGRRIVEAAEKHGRIVQTGTQSRSNPGMIAAMKHIHDGKIGEVKVARGLCYKPRGSIGPRGNYAVPASVDYDLWCGPAPKGPVTRQQFHYDWHWQWDYGNGDLGNQGIHQMDLARWGLGVKTLCNSVLSYGGRFGYTDAGDTANTQVVICDYGPKTLIFEVRGLATDGFAVPNAPTSFKGPTVGMVFEGTTGYVVMTSYHSGAAFDLDGKMTQQFSGDQGDAGHFQNFLAGVRSRKRSDLNGDILEGHLSSALCHLGNISYRLGQTGTPDQIAEAASAMKCQDDVRATLNRTLAHLKANSVDYTQTPFTLGALLTLDPAAETFQGNEKANAMLTREYRAPFIVPAKV